MFLLFPANGVLAIWEVLISLKLSLEWVGNPILQKLFIVDLSLISRDPK